MFPESPIPGEPDSREAQVVTNSRLGHICVFCGSSPGRSSAYGDAADVLGRLMAEEGITLVFGGGDVGLMGKLSRAVLAHQGKAVGVIPKSIYDRVDTASLTELHVVEDMHQRKALMYRLSDGFIVLPGGLGTMEEFFEVFTWYQLGFHLKPIGLLNVNGFFTPLDNLLDHMVREGFLKSGHLKVLLKERDPKQLLTLMREQRVSYIEKLS